MARFESRCPYPTRFHCYRTGLGAENLELFEALTRKGGGIFNCFTEADLAAAAQAHRSQCLQVESVRFVGGPAASDVLVAGPQGGGLSRRRADRGGAAERTPARRTIVVEGTFHGQKFAAGISRRSRRRRRAGAARLGRDRRRLAAGAERPEARRAGDSLLSAVRHRQPGGVVPGAGERERLQALQPGRGARQDAGRRPGEFLDEAWAALGKPVSAREAFVRFLDQVDGRASTVLGGDDGKHVAQAAGAAEGRRLRAAGQRRSPGRCVRKGDVPPEYLAARDADRRDVTAYLTEARRRADAGDADGAVRVLSSVIEEHPGRGDALRLVGYRLLDLKQPAQAARLFEQVQRQRPFEPHSYRDLARSLEESGKYGLAAVQYEIVLAGTWHNRFHDRSSMVVREEYAP